MSETNTVTIPLDEYFDLRMKADANALLMKELGELYGRMYQFESRLFALEDRVDRGADHE